jgi:long-subunit fatty acid transport protein
MIKRLLAAACLCFSLMSMAQEGTASPYSFYGLGEMRFKGTAENRAMGGLSVMPDSIHMNIANPAFYSDLRLVTLTAGATYATTRLKTNTDEEKSRRTTYDYLAVGIPTGKKFAFAFGLMPFTSVGYKLRNTVTEGDMIQRRRYNGTGGLNQAFLGASYKFGNFSVGAQMGYYFGNIENSALYRLYTLDSVSLQYGTRELNESSADGIGFTAGLAYTGKLNSKLSFSASATYSPESTVHFDNSRNLATVQFIDEDAVRVIDELDVSNGDAEVKVPSKFTFGASLGETKKWMAGAEVAFRQSDNMGNRYNSGPGTADISGFENAIKYSIGGYYIPNYTSFTSYAERIVYRAGLRYENTGLVLNGKSITDAAFTLGFGLPITGSFSNINVGLEYGKRGTRDAGLIEENYINFSIGLSFNDRWFVKRKYD